MKVIELVREMHDVCLQLRQQNKQIRFVPTMGALHAGHESLIIQAGKAALNDNESANVAVIVSIFVNRMQFNSVADLAKYPRTMEQDLELCRRLQVSYVFAPSNDQMYPTGGSLNQFCSISPPGHMTDELEGKSRPGHFKGMLTVVCKLFNIIQPHEAFFGEKDYQQLVLVDMMCHDLNMNIVIRPIPTVRDYDLLPLSSRNVRLTEKERRWAPIVFHLLDDARLAFESEQDRLQPRSPRMVIEASKVTSLCLRLDEVGGKLVQVDYLEMRCAKDLSEIDYDQSSNRYECRFGCARNDKNSHLVTRLLTSIIVGKIRLLDNMEIVLNSGSNKQP